MAVLHIPIRVTTTPVYRFRDQSSAQPPLGPPLPGPQEWLVCSSCRRAWPLSTGLHPAGRQLADPRLGIGPRPPRPHLLVGNSHPLSWAPQPSQPLLPLLPTPPSTPACSRASARPDLPRAPHDPGLWVLPQAVPPSPSPRPEPLREEAALQGTPALAPPTPTSPPCHTRPVWLCPEWSVYLGPDLHSRRAGGLAQRDSIC